MGILNFSSYEATDPTWGALRRAEPFLLLDFTTSVWCIGFAHMWDGSSRICLPFPDEVLSRFMAEVGVLGLCPLACPRVWGSLLVQVNLMQGGHLHQGLLQRFERCICRAFF